MQEQLTLLIVKRLTEAKDNLKHDFQLKSTIPVVRYFTVDNLLPREIAETIYAHFPKPREMHLIHRPGKIKLKYSHLRDTSPLLQAINAAIQDPRVVALVEEITGIPYQIPDPTSFAGGISTLLKGYYINPHLDNSHDVETKQCYRTVNVLYYLSPDWGMESGGNYELWDPAIKQRIVVPSLFNRLLVMETNRYSWHAVNPVLCNAARCCVFNYFFSKHSPEGVDYFFDHSSFKPRPEQKIARALESFKQCFSKKKSHQS